jgi:hypothetical protein
MPAMCHSGLLCGDYRPMCYVDADSQGAGKGTLIDVLTMPYVDNPAMVAQDDSSTGSIDEKVGVSISEGHNHVVLDNLKPTFKNKELSSTFLEAALTSDTIAFRAATQGSKQLDLSSFCLYVTTNGMAMSKDMAQRSLYVSIRKKDSKYKFKQYRTGHKNWLRENRPRIMSAIYSIMKEYVERGKPIKQGVDGHRFLLTVPILNYIVTDIIGLPDITEGISKRNSSKSDKNTDVVRAICFAVVKEDKLGSEYNNVGIYELLELAGNQSILGLDSNIEVYSDENNTTFTNEAKRAIGQKLSRVFSGSNLFGPKNKVETSIDIEEFTVTRKYHASNKTPLYTFEKTGGSNET